MQTSDQINEIAAALAKAQGELENPTKGKDNPHFKAKYADIADGLNAVRPILSKHGICVVQPTEIVDDGVILHTRLIHSSGQWIASTYPVSKFALHQQMGAAMTYAKRQALFSMVGIAGEADDDDGNAAGTADAGGGRSRPAAKPPAARAEAEAYVASALSEIADIDSVDRLNVWWKQESKNRTLHFTEAGDPLLKQLKDAATARGNELSTPSAEAPE